MHTVTYAITEPLAVVPLLQVTCSSDPSYDSNLVLQTDWHGTFP